MLKKAAALLCLCMLISIMALFVSCGSKELSDTDTNADTTIEDNKDTNLDIGTESDTSTDTETESETETDTDVNTETDAPSIYVNQTMKLGTNINKIKLIGRTPHNANGIISAWSASGFEFTANCKGTVRVGATLNIYESNTQNCYRCEYNVYIDGKYSKTVTIIGNQQYPTVVANGLDEGIHTIRLVRQQYVKNSYVTFTDVSIKGEFLNNSDYNKKAPLIEFVGDSITCGYGLDDTETPNHFDATKTHSYLAAQALGADYSFVAISGIGYTKSSPQHQENGVHKTILDIYDKTNYMYSDAKYTPTADQKADLVVINLVSNDAANGGKESEVKAAVKSLVSKARAMHGTNVKILFVGGMDMDRNHAANKWVDSAYNELGGESAGLYMIYVNKDTSAKDAHPSVEAQAEAGRRIADYIKSKNLI